MTVPAPQFARAKARALKALAGAEPDSIVPDTIRFADDHGFVIRLTHGGRLLQQIVPWHQITAGIPNVIERTVTHMLATLAQADFQKQSR